MPSNDILIALGILAALVLSVMLPFFIQRRIQQADKEDDDWKKSMEARMSAAEDKSHQQDLAIQERVTRADMERLTGKVFDEINGLRAGISVQLDGIRDLILKTIQRQ